MHSRWSLSPTINLLHYIVAQTKKNTCPRITMVARCQEPQNSNLGLLAATLQTNLQKLLRKRWVGREFSSMRTGRVKYLIICVDEVLVWSSPCRHGLPYVILRQVVQAVCSIAYSVIPAAPFPPCLFCKIHFSILYRSVKASGPSGLIK